MIRKEIKTSQTNLSVLVNNLIKTSEKKKLRCELYSDTLKYFFVKDPKFSKFCFLPKTYRHLQKVPVKPVILI